MAKDERSGPAAGDSTRVPAITEETFFGRAVVERGLATSDELQKCLSQQRSLEQNGKRMALQEIMVKDGILTNNQVRRLAGEMDDSAGRPAQQIPNFQILQRVGAGAMATVYKAKQLSLDRMVAIKVLPKRLSENPEFVERFYREGRAAAKLNHPNIVQAYDVGQAHGYHYFVMEFVDGKTIFDDLSRNTVVPEQTALEVALQVAKALKHAHDAGFIHRDVKPKNIMIDSKNVVKLADMGLARETSDVKAAMAEAGRAYGTPYYISPEQIRGELDIDFRADIYSLGATLYHMVTGRVPFDGPTPSAVMHKHLKEPLTPPDHLNTRLSTGLGEVIEVMMSKDRNGRYTSTADLITDLENVLRGQAPMMARRHYDTGLLAGLADGHRSAEIDAQTEALAAAHGYQDGGSGGAPVGLTIALVASILLNIVLGIMAAVR